MISFQWITLSFLLVSGALFAYLIPYCPAYFRYSAAGAKCTYHNDTEAAWPYFCKDNSNL